MTAQKLGYGSSRWCTYCQARQAGGQVRKGEQGCRVIFYKTLCREQTDDNGETETVSLPMRRTFVVFNTDQIDGLTEVAEAEDCPELERLAAVEALVQASGAELIAGEPAYIPALDKIAMPPLAAFQSQARNYATLLHELTHWVGHPRRLNRDLSARFGSEAYAGEELIARETAPAF